MNSSVHRSRVAGPSSLLFSRLFGRPLRWSGAGSSWRSRLAISPLAVRSGWNEEEALAKGTATVDYKFSNPVTKQIEAKMALAQKMSDDPHRKRHR